MECDLRFASHDAKFGIPETRLNISAIFAGLLTEHLPPAIALEVLLSGESLESKRVYELGFVNRLVETEEVEKEAMKLAKQICRNAPVSVRRTKELYYQSLEMNRNGSVSLAKFMLKELEGMDDSKEARQAFKEKRQPIWQEK
jgi:enoyl-CoA hydratase